ncbi:MAG: KpsF/GutQ family sugar-phosphate isomerase [Acidobacteriota bacterium]|nr:KpsF/GutQ family sugar-phosphate isomerase [Acidobacteriota bacterium]
MILDKGRQVLETAARSVAALIDDLDEDFEKVVRLIMRTEGRLILTGIGKSGIIARKLAATFASTGTPAFFVHPAEAVHGDLGMIVKGDTVIGMSNSGETEELVRLLELIRRQGANLIAITGNAESTLAKHADAAVCYRIDEEGCPIGLAPMASTTTSLALGDAVAATVMELKGFSSGDFARFHPGGKLGKKLLLVEQVMHRDDARPLVEPDAALSEALIEVSEKRLGMTAVALPQGLGLVTDGDIRRLLQQHGSAALEMKVGDICISNPKSIRPEALAVEALNLMEQHHITSILVIDDRGDYRGVVHLHDLWKTQLM